MDEVPSPQWAGDIEMILGKVTLEDRPVRGQVGTYLGSGPSWGSEGTVQRSWGPQGNLPGILKSSLDTREARVL